jgi:hypothetical protein
MYAAVKAKQACHHSTITSLPDNAIVFASKHQHITAEESHH